MLTYEAGLDDRTGPMRIVRAPLSKPILWPELRVRHSGRPSHPHHRQRAGAADRKHAKPRAELARALAIERSRSGLVFDCICRSHILGGQFRTAIRGISSELENALRAGFETYGEIAVGDGDLTGFHNTTTVVLAFPR